MASADLTAVLPTHQPSDVIGDDCDAVGFSSDARHYHTSTTFIQPRHVDASHSTFNNVQGIQSNVVNLAVSNTIVVDGPSHLQRFNQEFLQVGSYPENKRNKILRWLSPTIPSTNYHQALKMCHSNTGQWFIEDERFLEWKESSSSLLWLHGKRKLQ
jgi:hypothetical protein